MSAFSAITKPFKEIGNRIHGMQIISAIHDNDLEKLKKLLKENNLSNSSEDQIRLIDVALEKSNFTAIKIMFDHGFNPNNSAHSESLLYQAACSANYYDNYMYAKTLIDAGADINSLNTKYQTTPLIEACLGGRDDIVKLLVDSKADLNIFNKSAKNEINQYERTMLKVSNILNNHSQKIDLEEISGATKTLFNPLMAAYFGPDKDRISCLKILLEGGANTELQNDHGISFTSLIHATNDNEVINLVHSIKEQNSLSDFVDNEQLGMNIACG